MKLKVIMLCGAVLLTAGVQARLGESVEQCNKRYGDPTYINLNDDLTGLASYTKNDLVIDIHFLNGKADLVRYNPGRVSRIDLELARYLLQANGRDKQWDQLTDTEMILNEVLDENAQYPRKVLVDPITWKSKDEVLEASFSDSKGTFEARSSTYKETLKNGL